LELGYEIERCCNRFLLKILTTNGFFKDYKDAKGFIVIFTTNCPASKAYEERIIALDKKYKELG
jgi:hypothetical protein